MQGHKVGLDSNLAGAAVWSSRIVCPDVAVGYLSRQVRAYGPSSTAGYCQPWDCSFAGGVLSPLDSYVELELLDFTLCLLASSDAQDASWVVSFRSQLAAVLWLCHSSTPSLNCGNLRCHSCSYCSIVPRFSSFRRRQTEVKSYVRQSLRLCMVSLYSIESPGRRPNRTRLICHRVSFFPGLHLGHLRSAKLSQTARELRAWKVWRRVVSSETETAGTF